MRWNIIEIESNMIKVRMRKIMVGGRMHWDWYSEDSLFDFHQKKKFDRSKINFDKIKNEFLVRDISNSENVQFSLENSRSYLFGNNFFFLPLFFSWNSINCETSLKRLLWLLKYKRFKFASNGMLYLCLHLSTRSGKLLTITVHYSKLVNSLIKTL